MRGGERKGFQGLEVVDDYNKRMFSRWNREATHVNHDGGDGMHKADTDASLTKIPAGKEKVATKSHP